MPPAKYYIKQSEESVRINNTSKHSPESFSILAAAHEIRLFDQHFPDFDFLFVSLLSAQYSISLGPVRYRQVVGKKVGRVQL